jgi:hypothetical protein
MEWLLKSVIPRLQWPRPVFKSKRAITAEEHCRIIEAEAAAAARNRGSRNSDQPHYDERRDFYELLWHTGASQSDAAHLLAEDVDWRNRTIAYSRMKLKSRGRGIKPALIRFGAEVEAILKRRPESGPLFPYLRTVRPGDRATEFKQRCAGLEIKGVSLHSYRYAWAERALKCGYPERFAQQALGHNSKAVHHAYSKHAEVAVPSLDDWEKGWAAQSAEPRHGAGIVAKDVKRQDSFRIGLVAHGCVAAEELLLCHLPVWLLGIRLAFGFLASASAVRASRMRSTKTEAGSSFEFCSTSLPAKASCNSDWRVTRARSSWRFRVVARRSAAARRRSTSQPISVCSVAGGRGIGK